MKKLKILEKAQGPGLMRLLDGPWHELCQLENGYLRDSADKIELLANKKFKITAYKVEPYFEDSKTISYCGYISEGCGAHIIIDKIKSKNGGYVLRSYYPGSFFVLLVPQFQKKQYDQREEVEPVRGQEIHNNEPIIVHHACSAVREYQNENTTHAKKHLLQIYDSIKSDPSVLARIGSFGDVGKSLLLMLQLRLFSDRKALKMLANIGYLMLTVYSDPS
ncbi:hypothetical protein GCM10028791_44260 [Echinicola sediminis]